MRAVVYGSFFESMGSWPLDFAVTVTAANTVEPPLYLTVFDKEIDLEDLQAMHLSRRTTTSRAAAPNKAPHCRGIRLYRRSGRGCVPGGSVRTQRFSATAPGPRNKPSEWIWDPKGVDRVLYNLPALEAAIAIDPPKNVFLVEGEKDVGTFRAIGVTATTNAGGATKWSPTYTCMLKDATVVILAELPNAVVLRLPGLPHKGDVADWVAAGGTREELIVLAQGTLEAREKRRELPPETSDAPGDLTKLAAAYRLHTVAGSDLRHHSGLGGLHWDGTRWRPSVKAAERCAHKLGAEFRKDGVNVIDPDGARQIHAFAKRLETARGVESVLKLARSLEGIDADAIEFDTVSYLLNCSNATVDLRAGGIREHTREDYQTQLCPAPYDPSANCPRWRRFLSEIFDSDQALLDYIQVAAGYALTGSTEWQCFFVLHGSGANGKSTFVNALLGALGRDYAHQLDSEELLAHKHTRHSTERAALRGKRLVVASETNEARRLDTALVKSLTGGDRIRARFMRRDSFEFSPVLKLFLCTNHRPVIHDDSPAMWRRVRLIPFERRFEGASCDPGLPAALAAEAPGILAWCIEGATRAAQGEPSLPDAVRLATDQYREESDAVAEFLEERCDLVPEARVPKSALYGAYREFRGGVCESKRAFGIRLLERGYHDGSSGRARHWRGIALQSKDL